MKAKASAHPRGRKAIFLQTFNATNARCIGCLAVIVLAAWFSGCSTAPVPREEQERQFLTGVKPVLEYYCIECHDRKSAGKYGGLILETGELAMKTGRSVPVIRPGDPDRSLLYTVLRLGHEDVLGMPPAPDKISDDELGAVRQWIRSGAAWPKGPEGRLVLPSR